MPCQSCFPIWLLLLQNTVSIIRRVVSKKCLFVWLITLIIQPTKSAINFKNKNCTFCLRFFLPYPTPKNFLLSQTLVFYLLKKTCDNRLCWRYQKYTLLGIKNNSTLFLLMIYQAFFVSLLGKHTILITTAPWEKKDFLEAFFLIC